jgi:hypothetical protein
VLLNNGNTLGGTTYAARNVNLGQPRAGRHRLRIEQRHQVQLHRDHGLGARVPAELSRGIKIWDGSNQIGGNQGANLISGNTGSGIEIGPGGSGGNLVQLNYIGTDLNCSSPLPNGLRGVEINNTSVNHLSANTISGNGNEGVCHR